MDTPGRRAGKSLAVQQFRLRDGAGEPFGPPPNLFAQPSEKLRKLGKFCL
jgi:hypothetical protein